MKTKTGMGPGNHGGMHMKSAGIFIFLLLFVFCLTSEAEGQTLYEYKDKSGAVVITDRPPDKRIKGVRKYDYTPQEPQPSPAPGAGMEEKGLREPPRGPQAAPASSQEEMERQRREELMRYEAEERRKRDAAARRLEEEAMKPMPYSRENVRRQTELLERAQRIRSGQEPLPAARE